mgnify:CR=1 FL=1
MSNTKTVMGQAANTQGIPLDITDVFSTYLYTGTDAAQTITNGIDLDGEGGIVWLKNRTSAVDHRIVTPEISPTGASDYYVIPNSTAGRAGASDMISSFNSNGFSLDHGYSQSNQSGQTYASWTWRKAPKFFDCVTYTGNGTTQTISHNLGATVGTLLVKKTTAAENWQVYHRSLSVSNQEYLQLNLTSAVSTNGRYLFGNNTIMVAPTSTQFTLGQSAGTNENGATYVAYLFAHNDGDGGFGPSGDQDIIKCGSYTGTGANQNINLGFEAQWVLIKPTINANNWTIFDNMRGMPTEGLDGAARLRPNAAEAESLLGAAYGLSAHASGFTAKGSGADYNQNGNTYIYMAIRRGPLNPPTAGTEVFAIDAVNASAPYFTSGFPIDMAFAKSTSGSSGYVSSRITGLTEGEFDTTAAFSSSTGVGYDNMTGFMGSNPGSNYYGWMWKRAPSYFDAVAYTGNGTAGRTVSHNLGVAPEMMWVKERANSNHWAVYHKGLNGGVDPEDYFVRLNLTNAAANSASYWNDTAPTDSVFTVAAATVVNRSGSTFIAYLFATLAGISKVGSVTHSGTTNVDCGFSSGARFVMLKRTDATGDWYIWDSVRGIVSGNDPYLLLNSQAAEVTNTDYIDPLSSGFTISDAFTDGDYIFYAIA